MKNEPRICDICCSELRPGQVGYIFYDYLYCPACWSIHRENERKELAKRRGDWGDLPL